VSVLDRYPFNRDSVPVGAGAVLLWWESRRLAYNIAVGITGIVTVGLLVANSLIRGDDCGVPDLPLFALLLVIGYGVMANVCYTLGGFAEIVARITMGYGERQQTRTNVIHRRPGALNDSYDLAGDTGPATLPRTSRVAPSEAALLSSRNNASACDRLGSLRSVVASERIWPSNSAPNVSFKRRLSSSCSSALRWLDRHSADQNSSMCSRRWFAASVLHSPASNHTP
jgi:hypothetical protein